MYVPARKSEKIEEIYKLLKIHKNGCVQKFRIANYYFKNG